MEITEVRIKLMEGSEDRLRGFCSITFDDCFVVRDLKIIEGNNGAFVAMPSRKLTSHCSKCRSKNHLRARYCNQCGNKLKSGDLAYDSDGRAKLYADIAHPVNAECREMIQARVIEELDKELELARKPGYKSRYDDDYEMRGRTRSQDDKGRRSRDGSGRKPAGNKPAGKSTSEDENASENKESGKERVDSESKTPETKDRIDSAHQDSGPHGRDQSGAKVTGESPETGGPESSGGGGGGEGNGGGSSGRQRGAIADEFGKGIFD